METIEIRSNKKRLIPMLVLLFIGTSVATYYVYFSGKVRNSNLLNIVYLLSLASFIYMMYFQLRMLLRNEAVLTFTKSDITINQERKPVSFLWLQIISWEIKKDDSTHYLIIKTSDSTKKINISWLDKKPIEIEKLLYTYKKV